MNKYFSEQLRKERSKQGLTAQALADLCGISRSYITLIESGSRMPGKKNIPVIAAALHLKTAIVLNWYLEDIRTKMGRDE